MSAARQSAKIAGTLAALAAGALCLASCRVPPSPPPTDGGSTLPVSYAVFSWKTESDFKRISEYFTDVENTGANLVARTDPAVREGLYFILGVEPFGKIPAGSRATLRYFRPDRHGVQTSEFVLPEFSDTPAGEIRLGLTGEAWPEPLKKERPTAWEFSVRSPEGELLVLRHSFLWSEQ